LRIFRGQQELTRFEAQLKEYFGVKHCFLVSSGKAAFTLILLALKELAPGRDEVLIPAFTCYSVPSSVVRAGLRIRLCDLRVDSLDFDFAQMSAMLSEAPPPQTDTRAAVGASDSPVEIRDLADSSGSSIKRVLAVVPTHLFGYPADVARLRKLNRDPGITIVEDAAQAMAKQEKKGKLEPLAMSASSVLAEGKRSQSWRRSRPYQSGRLCRRPKSLGEPPSPLRSAASAERNLQSGGTDSASQS